MASVNTIGAPTTGTSADLSAESSDSSASSTATAASGATTQAASNSSITSPTSASSVMLAANEEAMTTEENYGGYSSGLASAQILKQVGHVDLSHKARRGKKEEKTDQTASAKSESAEGTELTAKEERITTMWKKADLKYGTFEGDNVNQAS